MSHRQPSFVGRLDERAALGEVVRTARRGGQLAVVEGEAGIGKTRLVETTLEAARDAGVAVLSSRAEALETHRPFGAIVDCVGSARLAEHLGVWDVRPDVGGERQFRVAETVLELLDELCARGPVVVAIEDLHWADPATLGVLARVAAGIERLPAALADHLVPPGKHGSGQPDDGAPMRDVLARRVAAQRDVCALRRRLPRGRLVGRGGRPGPG